MGLSKEAIEEFKDVYCEEFKEEISRCRNSRDERVADLDFMLPLADYF